MIPGVYCWTADFSMLLADKIFPWNGGFSLITKILLAEIDLDALFFYAEIANLEREIRIAEENTRGQTKDRRQPTW